MLTSPLSGRQVRFSGMVHDESMYGHPVGDLIFWDPEEPIRQRPAFYLVYVFFSNQAADAFGQEPSAKRLPFTIGNHHSRWSTVDLFSLRQQVLFKVADVVE